MEGEGKKGNVCLLQKCKDYWRRGKIYKASRCLLEAVATQDKDGEASVLLGICYQQNFMGFTEEELYPAHRQKICFTQSAERGNGWGMLNAGMLSWTLRAFGPLSMTISILKSSIAE